MPRYIDANEVLEFPGSVGSGYEEEMRELIEKHIPEDICDSYVDELEGLCKDVVSSVMNIVKTSPIVDAVEVVRCKDCVHCSDGPGFCVIMGGWVNPEGYCYHAERKRGEQ